MIPSQRARDHEEQFTINCVYDENDKMVVVHMDEGHPVLNHRRDAFRAGVIRLDVYEEGESKSIIFNAETADMVARKLTEFCVRLQANEAALRRQ